MVKNQNAVVVTATKKGLIIHSNPQQIVKYEVVSQTILTKENRPKIEVEKIHLNLIQRQMYRRLMYGLNDFDDSQIKALSTQALNQIQEDYKKAKVAIHVLKAKKLCMAETKLINDIFNKDIGKNDFDWYIDIPKEYTLRKLNISTKEIINDFIKRALLPKDFYTLTPETIKL